MILGSILNSLLGKRPIGFIDVGARGGVHPLVEPLGSAVAVLGFEPDLLECERILADRSLQKTYARLELEAVALSNVVGEATLHELSTPTNTSLLPPNSTFVERYAMDKWREVGQTRIQTVTLDEVLLCRRKAEAQWGEAIKIDTQGTEYDILLGAQKILRERTLFLCVEVSFCELYEGQKLFSDVELLLRNAGFSFYGFERTYHRARKLLDKRTHWGRERMIQADAYFFKDPLDRSLPGGAPIDRRSHIILAAFGAVTGYHDFALEMLEGLGSEAADFRRAIGQQAILSTAESQRDARILFDSVASKPEEANILIGKFVDARRQRNDYFDVG